MRFFQGGLPRIVWSPIKNKVIAEFENGVIATDDKETIDILRKIGYQSSVENSIEKEIEQEIDKYVDVNSEQIVDDVSTGKQHDDEKMPAKKRGRPKNGSSKKKSGGKRKMPKMQMDESDNTSGKSTDGYLQTDENIQPGF